MVTLTNTFNRYELKFYIVLSNRNKRMGTNTGNGSTNLAAGEVHPILFFII